jgi:long-chain fatty acid transport protein
MNLFQNGGITAGFDTPAIMHLSVMHRYNPQWKVSADVSYVTWSKFKELRINFDNPAQPDSVQPENWRDVTRYSVGADYTYSPTWTFRGGVAYDQTPIRDQYRDARLPGDNRTWIALGATWHLSAQSSLDFGYAHLFLGSDIPLNEPVPGSSNTGLYHIQGTYKADADITGIQFRYKF